jgi:hypothetical protein
MSSIEQEKHGNTDVRSEERASVPLLRPEDIEPIDQTKNGKADDDAPSAPLIDGRAIGEIRDVLRFAGFPETQEDDAAADP